MSTSIHIIHPTHTLSSSGKLWYLFALMAVYSAYCSAVGQLSWFDRKPYICIYTYKGSGTYPCALLSRQFLTVENTKKNTSA